ncbi:Uncharacterized protein conserved in bacteria [Legionella beliardensis]|uniref:Uncharacterized protein conserved in bacteria n=1 Tax=Legionella beliardensis TaxID=91822 RepID=A0A378I303_9GAMM|nr:SPOR domain-containing protein [Legionella beliardensis]STX29363.1 Uncharacterized protein conserved in bacteria [Legionella beliardensis]
MNYHRLTVCICFSALASCGRVSDIPYPPTYTSQRYDDMRYYSQVYSQGINYGDYNSSAIVSSQEVAVPESYHVGAYHAPARAKDRDKTWVSSQNPQGYTIEIADDEKAAQVAKKLYMAPKTDRTAEVRYQNNGKNYYKGLYGSFSSQEEAQKALNNLPEDLKQSAGVKNWGAIQSSVSE